MKFQDIYKIPFKLDGIISGTVWTADNEEAFNFEEDEYGDELSNEVKKLIIRKLNGELIHFKLNDLIIDDTDIYYFDRHIITIRGWGHLIGMGGLNIHPDKAKVIQDEFGEWIINTLSK